MWFLSEVEKICVDMLFDKIVQKELELLSSLKKQFFGQNCKKKKINL